MCHENGLACASKQIKDVEARFRGRGTEIDHAYDIAFRTKVGMPFKCAKSLFQEQYGR
jgi:hypothetical protein